jgi:hypothetical protein
VLCGQMTMLLVLLLLLLMFFLLREYMLLPLAWLLRRLLLHCVLLLLKPCQSMAQPLLDGLMHLLMVSMAMLRCQDVHMLCLRLTSLLLQRQRCVLQQRLRLRLAPVVALALCCHLLRALLLLALLLQR